MVSHVPATNRGIAAPFGTIVSYTITEPGSGYDDTTPPVLTFTDAGTGTSTGTAVIEDGQLVAVTFTALETALTSDPTVTVAAPGGSGNTTATVDLIDNRLSDTVDNIYPYDALEAQSALGDAVLNVPVYGRGIRAGNLSGSNEDVSIVDGYGNTRTIQAFGDRTMISDVQVQRIRETGTTPDADEFTVFI